MISRYSSLFFSIIMLLCSMYFFVTPTYAQFGNSDDISVALLPRNPQANQDVLITIESYSIDLNSTKISWYVNNKLTAQGIGVKKIYARTGNLGSETSIKIVFDTKTETFSKTITLIPSSVNILWEARTYTPPFYKGKALFTHQSNIIFVANPDIRVGGKVIPKENLVYTWSKNGTVLGDQNGYGKHTLSLVGSIISRPLTIDLTVEDTNSGISAFNTITVEPIEPSVLLYKEDPLYGTQYQKALGKTIPLAGKEITLQAVPYFFSTTNSLPSRFFSFKWFINGTEVADNEMSLTKTFRKVADTFGTSNISVSIEQTERILQFAQSSLSIDFTKESNSDSF